MKKITILCSCIAVFAAAAAPALAALHEVNRFKLGGDGGWDALTVDGPSRRLYVARSNRVMVIDADAGTLIGEVSGLEGAHAVVILSELGKGYASSGKTGELVSFDLKTLQVTGRIKVGDKPDLILYDPFSKFIFVFNGKSKNAVAVDPVHLKLVSTIALPGKPEFAATDETGHVFVNLEDKSELAVIDAKTMALTKEYPLAPCEEPTGLSIDKPSKKLLVGCGNKMAAIVDSETGKVMQTFKAGDKIDGTAFDSSRHTGYVSAGEGLLSVLTEEHGVLHLAQQLKTAQGARTLALDPKTGNVFMPSAQFEATSESGPHVRPKIKPDSFFLLVVGK